MPRYGWLALLLFLPTLPGCLFWPEHSESSSWMQQFKKGALSHDHALIEFALIERPHGDEYINRRLWEQTDEFFEKRAVLEDNGFRVGQLIAQPPSEFQQLLLSPRSCSNPKALIFPSGRTAPIYVGSVQPQMACEYVQDSLRTELFFDQARHAFDVTARFSAEGKTILTFTPKVEHGGPALPFQASPDRGNWELRIEKVAKKFPELTWETTLGPNQYLFIGGRLDRERTLGCTAFTDGGNEVQRLLVVRNCRSVTSAEAQQTSAPDLVRADRTTPLALQATAPAARGKSN